MPNGTDLDLWENSPRGQKTVVASKAESTLLTPEQSHVTRGLRSSNLLKLDPYIT
ncbi:hypothetical protein E4U31_007913, partial [Claviceps sp. LM219 group G6]